MVIAYWIVAGLLAGMNLLTGGMKLAQPKEKLHASGQAWTEDFSAAAVKAIAAAEVLGAVGLILPPAINVAPVLAPVAAIGLTVVQVGAFVVHSRRGETKQLGANVMLALLGIAAAVLGFAAWV